MGDARRHRSFARFIDRTYPSLESVLIVAGGKGRIARLLAKKGVRVRVEGPLVAILGRPSSCLSRPGTRKPRTAPVPEGPVQNPGPVRPPWRMRVQVLDGRYGSSNCDS